MVYTGAKSTPGNANMPLGIKEESGKKKRRKWKKHKEIYPITSTLY
jgi:hypothetical protein